MEIGRRTINRIGKSAEAVVIPARYRREALAKTSEVVVGWVDDLLIAGPPSAESRIARLLLSLEAAPKSTGTRP